MTILDNVAVGAFQKVADLDQARRRGLEVLKLVGLAPQADRLADGLTSRELRLLELARALAGRPKLLLLDETLAGLGNAEADEIIELLRRLSGPDLTIVIIEHTMQAMVRLVDRFVVLDHGAVLANGPPQAITRDPAVIDAYLGRNWRQAAETVQ
jgi:branched-chain amino acid transport system permease protein